MRFFAAAPLVGALLAGLLALPGMAAAQPRGAVAEPVLMLSGKLGPNSATGVRLDLETLQTLQQRSFTTRAPWTRGAHKYTGPLLRDVLAAAQASGSQLDAVALNDQAVTIPVADAQQHGVIVALRVDDKPIGVRELGPLMLMYPFDSKAQLQATEYHRRAVWQLKSLRVD